MARTDTLPHFLTDVADAIRTKKGSSEPIQASDFDTEIENLPSGGGADLSDYFELTISEGDNSVSGYMKMIKNIPSTTTVSGTSLYYAFNKFQGTTISLFDTSNVTSMSNMFSNCSNLISIPLFNTSNVTNMSSMFYECTNLTTIPLLDTSNVNNMNNMFVDCPNLTDTSLDNILQMCINNNISLSTSKKLSKLGLRSNNYPASRIEALPHYQDFIDAGWTIGY